jgi:hypothetical protein
LTAFMKVVGVVRSTTFLLTTLCTSVQNFRDNCCRTRVKRNRRSRNATSSGALGLPHARVAPAAPAPSRSPQHLRHPSRLPNAARLPRPARMPRTREVPCRRAFPYRRAFLPRQALSRRLNGLGAHASSGWSRASPPGHP